MSYLPLGETRASQDAIPVTIARQPVTGTWTARERPTTTQTTTGRAVAIAPGDVSKAEQCIASGGLWNPVRYSCEERTVERQPLPQSCPSGQTWSFRTNSCIPFADPYTQQKAACVARTGFRWNDIRKKCESTDPFVAAKNRCAIMNGRWDSVRNICQTVHTQREVADSTRREPVDLTRREQPPFQLPTAEEDAQRRAEECRARGGTPLSIGSRSQSCREVSRPPDVSVLDWTKDTNAAPDSIAPPVYVPTMQPGQPISVQVTGAGESILPKWLVPALIAGATMLL